jgi:hypothetical protein
MQKLKKDGDAAENGADCENPEGRNYLMQQHRNCTNSSIIKNDCIGTFLQGLARTESTDHSFWKANKKLSHANKPPPLQRGTSKRGTRVRKHLADAFQPHPSENEPEEEEALIQLLGSSYQHEPPTKCFEGAEVQEVISNLNPKNSSGYDLANGTIVKELSVIGIIYLTQLFSVILLKGHFPAKLKLAQVFLI